MSSWSAAGEDGVSSRSTEGEQGGRRRAREVLRVDHEQVALESLSLLARGPVKDEGTRLALAHTLDDALVDGEDEVHAVDDCATATRSAPLTQ